MGERTRPSIEAWPALVLEVDAAVADELIGASGSWLRGAQLEPIPDAADRVRLQLFLRLESDVEQATTDVGAALAELGGTVGPIDVITVEDGNWVERYQASLQPFPLGRGFQVFPDGVAGDAGDRTPLLLVPGRAFGTGEHATTASCVELLERFVQPGQRWTDLGCGSAVLSLVAASLGAAEVRAIEIDPEAIAVARHVLRVNAAPGSIRIVEGGVEQLPTEPHDGLVANINAPVFLDAAATLVRAVRPEGLLIASGFPIDQAGEVVAALTAVGLQPVERVERDPWCTIAFRRDRP